MTFSLARIASNMVYRSSVQGSYFAWKRDAILFPFRPLPSVRPSSSSLSAAYFDSKGRCRARHRSLSADLDDLGRRGEANTGLRDGGEHQQQDPDLGRPRPISAKQLDLDDLGRRSHRSQI